MTPENFVYWLHGFAEIQQAETVSDRQWQIIKDHLQEVFEKKTPTRVLADDSSLKMVLSVPKKIEGLLKDSPHEEKSKGRILPAADKIFTGDQPACGLNPIIDTWSGRNPQIATWTKDYPLNPSAESFGELRPVAGIQYLTC